MIPRILFLSVLTFFCTLDPCLYGSKHQDTEEFDFNLLDFSEAPLDQPIVILQVTYLTHSTDILSPINDSYLVLHNDRWRRIKPLHLPTSHPQLNEIKHFHGPELSPRLGPLLPNPMNRIHDLQFSCRQNHIEFHFLLGGLSTERSDLCHQAVYFNHSGEPRTKKVLSSVPIFIKPVSFRLSEYEFVLSYLEYMDPDPTKGHFRFYSPRIGILTLNNNHLFYRALSIPKLGPVLFKGLKYYPYPAKLFVYAHKNRALNLTEK